MSNVTKVLREEITRLARKESRRQVTVIHKASVRYRRDIATLKRQVVGLARKTALMESQLLKRSLSASPVGDRTKARFSARGIRAMRKRLGLPATLFAKLVGVTPLTIAKWEQGKSRPRQANIEPLSALRGVGKREARARLEHLGKARPKRRK